MMLHGRILSVLSLSLRHVAVDDSGILAVRHHRQVQVLSRLEDALQRFHLIHQHITGAGTHEELDARHMVHIQLGKGIHVVIGGTIEEAVVYMTLLCAQLSLVIPRLQFGSLRHGIRHFHIGSHAAIGSRTALTLDIRLAGQSRLTEMNMVIYYTRQNETPRSIHYFIVDATGSHAFKYIRYHFTIDKKITQE